MSKYIYISSHVLAIAADRIEALTKRVAELESLLRIEREHRNAGHSDSTGETQ